MAEKYWQAGADAMQAVAPGSEAVPAPHDRQQLKLTVEEYVPAAQEVQAG